jgi:Protein of unknown function (DUF3187)
VSESRRRGRWNLAAQILTEETLTQPLEIARGALRGVGPAALLVLAAATASAETTEPAADSVTRRGPSEVRDEQVLAQPRLTLPATSPDTVGRGATSVGSFVLWSNSFGWTQNVPGEHPADRRFLVDGETATVDLTVTHGLRDDLDLGLRLPLRWRGGGVLDGLIDSWHRLFNLPTGNRPSFLKDAFRVDGLTTSHEPFSWDTHTGVGVGAAEPFARWRFHRGARWSLALIGRAALPTATGPFAGNGVGFGLQSVAAGKLGSSCDMYLGLGGTTQSGLEVRGVGYEPARVHGFFAFEWRPARRLSLIAETNAASRLVKDIDRYPGLHWIMNGEARIDVSARARIELGFTENFKDQMATTDFAIHFGLEIRPASRRGSPPSGNAGPR